MTVVFRGEKEIQTQKDKGEVWGRQRQKLGRCSCEPRNAGSQQELEGAGRTFPESSRWGHGLADTLTSIQ